MWIHHHSSRCCTFIFNLITFFFVKSHIDAYMYVHIPCSNLSLLMPYLTSVLDKTWLQSFYTISYYSRNILYPFTIYWTFFINMYIFLLQIIWLVITFSAENKSYKKCWWRVWYTTDHYCCRYFMINCFLGKIALKMQKMSFYKKQML